MKCNSRVMNIEKATLTPLVLSISGRIEVGEPTRVWYMGLGRVGLLGLLLEG